MSMCVVIGRSASFWRGTGLRGSRVLAGSRAKAGLLTENWVRCGRPFGRKTDEKGEVEMLNEFSDFGDNLPVIRRKCVRLVVVDAEGLILLLATKDPTYPELGTWWEFPGGGIDDGESLVQASVRELWEETGLTIHAKQIGPPLWSRNSTFKVHGKRHVQSEQVMVVSLEQRQPDLDGANREGVEIEDYFDHRWWSVPDILTTSEKFYPGRMAKYLPEVLAGRHIVEPFEQWS